MSDKWLVFVSDNPDWQPENESQVGVACAVLKRFFPSNDGIEYKFYNQRTFIDSGENFEGAFCPSCGEICTDWWLESLEESYNSSNFADLDVVTECCGKSISLNDFQMPFPVKIARFELSIMNPNDPATPGVLGVGTLPVGITSEISSKLNTNLVVIRRWI